MDLRASTNHRFFKNEFCTFACEKPFSEMFMRMMRENELYGRCSQDILRSLPTKPQRVHCTRVFHATRRRQHGNPKRENVKRLSLLQNAMRCLLWSTAQLLLLLCVTPRGKMRHFRSYWSKNNTHITRNCRFVLLMTQFKGASSADLKDDARQSGRHRNHTLSIHTARPNKLPTNDRPTVAQQFVMQQLRISHGFFTHKNTPKNVHTCRSAGRFVFNYMFVRLCWYSNENKYIDYIAC